MSVISSQPLTIDEFLSLPNAELFERNLIAGELRERPMTLRNFSHSRIQMKIGYAIEAWLRTQAKPHGVCVGGEAAVSLGGNPPTLVGVDVAYIPAAVLQQTNANARYVNGVPVLVVEIVSPSDADEDIHEKVEAYLNAGAPHVWVVRPRPQIITAHRPGKPPESFNITHDIFADPEMPGFGVKVAEIFAV